MPQTDLPLILPDLRGVYTRALEVADVHQRSLQGDSQSLGAGDKAQSLGAEEGPEGATPKSRPAVKPEPVAEEDKKEENVSPQKTVD